MALGARPADIARRVVAHGAALTGLGVSLGLLLSAALASVLGALLFGVAPLDPLTFAGVAVLTSVSTLAAGAVPALMAARVDPNVALRAD
jgi:ABC-type antimicrobial peptide transport system permease subunit